MPRAHVLIEAPIEPSFRVEQVRGLFDVPETDTIRHEWQVDLPVDDFPWQIGLIVGPSGAGKTTLARRLFPDAYFHERYDWPETKAIVDGFPAHLEGRAIMQALSSVGFSSPLHWLKRFAHLSNGQKFRCELARLILEDAEVVICDEFTSVVDRDAARISAAAVARTLRRRGAPRFIALSCHHDVIDWLDPDWVFDCGRWANGFARRRLRRRPAIKLCIHQAGVADWNLFRGHHYLSSSLHGSARCFVAAWNGQPVAFTSYLHQAGVRGLKREHRTVVLPDFQGVGIGNALSEWLGANLLRQGFRFRSVTSHPALIRQRAARACWQLKRFGHQRRQGRQGTGQAATSSTGRLTATFEYVGQTDKPDT
ncbi:MAG: ABC transporter ATP-binding protein [Gemmataceae bacterium]